ncbi:hypothetical protein [Kaistella sp.]|uniref:hypothetical protein n=1 Tax=Kaistella sp. TaxID=2782235 RepID=UPI003C3774FF
MKNSSIIIILFFLISCGKETATQAIVVQENTAIAPYDTIAIDSFSQGATSVDVARKIRMSSQKVQDSLKQIKLKNEEELVLKKAKDEQLKAEKKAEEIKNKAAEELHKAKEKASSTIPKTE